jgi:hypothetical protein
MTQTMSAYCKAYYLSQLRSFSSWIEPDAGSISSDEENTIVYLHDNYVVTTGIVVNEGVIFNDSSDAWKKFCTEQLGFSPVLEEAIPSLAEAAAGNGSGN